MSRSIVQVPVSLLSDASLTPAAKVLWIALRSQAGPATAAKLAFVAGLTNPTVRRSMTQLETHKWYAPPHSISGSGPTSSSTYRPEWTSSPVEAGTDQALIPSALISNRKVRPGAKLLYCILQTLPGFDGGSGSFTHATLNQSASTSAVTVRKAIRELAGTGWLDISRENQMAPVQYTLRHLASGSERDAASHAKRRLENMHYSAEAIMKEYLSLLIDCDEFEDNARPGFLINPLTGERMELDRYDPPATAFEFHGAQYFRTTELYPGSEALAARQARDLMKEALCARRGITLVVIQWEDLTLDRMRQKVGSQLPLRDLRGYEPVIQLLRKVGAAD